MAEYPADIQQADKAAPLLITGAGGFLGRNLTARLRAEGFTGLLLFDLDSPEGALEDYAARARFVFHLAGVNRPVENDEFYSGNTGLTQTLMRLLSARADAPPVVLSSSAQAGNGTDYAKSKEQAEAAVLDYGARSGAPVYVYRLPGVFGKWSRPNYNSVVATFCHNTARGLPIEVRDPGFQLPLCYVDDVVDSFLGKLYAVLGGTPQRPPETDGGAYYYGIDPTYAVTLGWLASLIRSFAATRKTLAVPNMGDGATRKLWATYLSFLPPQQCAYPLQIHTDARGSFTEMLRSHDFGQVSVNVAKPGILKGNHWHDTKNEKFLVVSGKAVICLRRLGEAEVARYEVCGEAPTVVDIPPGFTHSIQNVGEGDLVTLIWASALFDKDKPDTWFEEV